MPGYTLLTGDELEGDILVHEKDRDKTIKMFYMPIQSSGASVLSSALECRKAYYFISDCADEIRRSDDFGFFCFFYMSNKLCLFMIVFVCDASSSL